MTIKPHLAKWQLMSGGMLRMPVVLRVSVGSKYGAQHSQDWTSLCAHIPGLKVVFPATPYDYEKVVESVKKTGRILLASDACERGSILQTMAAKITQFAFNHLDSPPVVVGARNWITPPDEVEDSFFPFESDILDAIHQHIEPLPGYTIKRPCDAAELKRRSAEGI